MKPLSYWEADIKVALGCNDEVARKVYRWISGSHFSFSNASREQLNLEYRYALASGVINLR